MCGWNCWVQGIYTPSNAVFYPSYYIIIHQLYFLLQNQVVQCYNRGWDGNDIQWECKTDMDNAYRFGQISVSCEGYSYPDDPYILKGSCGVCFVHFYILKAFNNVTFVYASSSTQ